MATPGASVRVQIPTEDPRLAIAVPASAVRKGPGGDFVFVVETDSSGKARARMREVSVVAMQGDDIVISDGLNAGERVATSGSFKLRDQVLVAVTNPQEAVAHQPAEKTTDQG